MAKKKKSNFAPPPPGAKIPVFEVPQAEIDQFAGRDWDEIVLERPAYLHEAMYASFDFAREGQTPPNTGRRMLPLGFAWLREIDGRAFLYYQNW